jgi:Lar family restriction alleviation protein
MSDTVSEDVKPCPFCGKQPSVRDYREHEDQTGETYGYAAVECACIGSHGGLFFHFDTIEEAVEVWNRRAYLAATKPAHPTRLREAISNLMDATRAECRDGPHAPVEEAQEAVEAALSALPGDVTVKALKAHLREHWLVSVVCDHEAKTDTATCSCSQWRDEPHPSVGAAVDAWIEHVFAALASPPMPGRGEGFVLVPVEITLEMQKAYFDVIDKNMERVTSDPRFGRFDSNREAYRAMLAASPPKEDTQQ